MAVAVTKTDVDKLTPPATITLPGASLRGMLFLFAGFLLVYQAIPYLFWQTGITSAHNYLSPSQLESLGIARPHLVVQNSFLGNGLLLAAMLGSVYLLVKMWPQVLPKIDGAKAGVTVLTLLVLGGAVALYLILLMAEQFAKATGMTNNASFLGMMLGALFVGFFFSYVYRLYHQEKFLKTLPKIEEQGWFTSAPYNKNQGVKMRRFTMLGILLLIGAGIWVYTISAFTDARAFAANSYFNLVVPFVHDRLIPIVRSPHITFALVFGVLGFWIAYRIVNYPPLADFLIATESEMAKVYWSSRSKLYQDTIVVLVTMVLLTMLIFGLDSLWFFVLQILGVISLGR